VLLYVPCPSTYPSRTNHPISEKGSTWKSWELRSLSIRLSRARGFGVTITASW
jgi:hypothetical protein